MTRLRSRQGSFQEPGPCPSDWDPLYSCALSAVLRLIRALDLSFQDLDHLTRLLTSQGPVLPWLRQSGPSQRYGSRLITLTLPLQPADADLG